MAGNYVQSGDRWDFVATAAVTVNSVQRKNNLVGVAINAGVTGDTIVCSHGAVFSLPKATSLGLAQGAAAWIAATGGNILGTATGNHLVGEVWRSATTGLSTVDVLVRKGGLSQPI